VSSTSFQAGSCSPSSSALPLIFRATGVFWSIRRSIAGMSLELGTKRVMQSCSSSRATARLGWADTSQTRAFSCW